MTTENFREALSIITESKNVKVSFNVPINGSYNTVHQIVIHNSNASLIRELIDAKFSLFMGSEGLVVDKF